MEYIIIDAMTADCCTGFKSLDEARQFILNNTKPGETYVILTADNYEQEMAIEDYSCMKLVIAPMEWVENEGEAELIITDGDRVYDSYLGQRAEFAEDLLTTDILDNPGIPVKCFRE